MGNLVKIRDVSTKYGITARTLRYYEEMGLINSTRSDRNDYRLYDDRAIKRIEQTLILRKLNISIKDIRAILDDDNSKVVLEVLSKKVDNIDDEVALLHELKDIILDFIKEVKSIDFTNDSNIKSLYAKATEIETQFISTDYVGKSNLRIGRLDEITEKLDKQVPDVMVIRVPKFKAITTGMKTIEEIFSEGGLMSQLWEYYTYFKPVIFDCLDFGLLKDEKCAMICSIKDNVTESDVKPFSIIDFPGGLYAMAVSIDEDDVSITKVQNKIYRWLENTNFEVDESRTFMFNMPYLDESNEFDNDIEKGLGYKQMQRYVPIKLKM